MSDNGLAFDARLAHPPAAQEAWSNLELRVAPDALTKAFAGFQAEQKKARTPVPPTHRR